MRSNKRVSLICPNCNHNWDIARNTYMTMPYTTRTVSPLLQCIKCGSQGEIVKRKKKN